MTTSSHAVPASEPPPLSGPACQLCGAPAVVHWQRRLTKEEFTAHLTWEQERRDRARELADPQYPAPDFGPLPTPQECTTSVFACAAHAITLDAAALVHRDTCTAPSPSGLTGCDCTPESPPAREPEPGASGGLPPAWSSGR
ncbi:hypothetical protein [Streptomyces sp. URMC 124]|uniref:hypothetical protein n=1 Tax=Streptomyces sp. URMC 124 TaxID=3423405 RepID=UPI003F1D8068